MQDHGIVWQTRRSGQTAAHQVTQQIRTDTYQVPMIAEDVVF